MKKFGLLFLLFCFYGLLNAQYKNFWKPLFPEFDSLTIEIEKNYIRERSIQKGKDIVKKMYGLAGRSDNQVLLSRAIHWDIYNQCIENKTIDSRLFSKAIKLIDTNRNEYDYTRLKSLKASNYVKIGNYLKAYKIYMEIQPYFENIGDDFMAANILVNKGNIFLKINEYEKALEEYQKAQVLYKQSNIKELSIKNQLSIGNALYHTGEKDRAVETLRVLKKSLSKTRDTLTLINTLYSLSIYPQNSDERSYYAKKNYELTKNYRNKYFFTRAGINYGALLIDQGKLTYALNYLYEAKKSTDSTNDLTASRLIYNNLSRIYTDKKQWDSAYYYTNLYHIYNDSILGADKKLEINKIEARESISKIEQQNELQRKITIAILFGVCCLSVAVISIIYFRNKKIKIQKQLKETENEKLETEIGSKNRELASNTLLLTEKNRVLEELSEHLKELEFHGNIPEKEEKEIQKKIEDHLYASNEWEYFKLHFENVHPEFFYKLKKHSSSISENELRLCAYIRIGMENKQIARMLSVLPNSVKTSRYRLRKKLNLSGEVSLEDFLRNL